MDIATEFLFGQSLESLSPNPRLDVARFSAAVEKSLKGVQRRVMLNPVLRFLPEDKGWHSAFGEVNQLFDHYIDLALADQKAYPKPSEEAAAELSEVEPPFVMLRELVKETQDRQFIRHQLLSCFLPMYQAAPIGLSDLFFQVARVSGVWTKLRAEALELGETPLTFEVLKSQKYLQCVIKESEFAATIFTLGEQNDNASTFPFAKIMSKVSDYWRPSTDSYAFA